jgi:hypothetical protein
MAQSSPQTLYSAEFIDNFEVGVSLLRDTVTTEGVAKGNSFIFASAGTAGATAVTRGINGLIPGRGVDQTQYTCTLEEWHDVPEVTDFNEFSSQASIRRKVIKDQMIVINRKLDNQIVTELSAGVTQYLGTTAATANPGMFSSAAAVLNAAGVPWNEITAAVTPAAYKYLMDSDKFAKQGQWIDHFPWMDGGPAFKNKQQIYNWMGLNFIVCNNLPNLGTSSEVCYIYHRNSVGHAIGKAPMSTVGFDERHAYHYVRTTMYTGAKALLTTGIIGIRHDGSAVVATA